MTPATALQLCLLFGGASLMSIGGGNSVVPEIELQAVGTYHWLTRAQFADLFALAQAAPGPSILIVTLVGYSTAGVLGAVLGDRGNGAACGGTRVGVRTVLDARADVAVAVSVRAWAGAGCGRPDRGERHHCCAWCRSHPGAICT